MAAGAQGWENIAKAKRDSIRESFPKEWLIGSIPTAETQRDVTGDYICKFLSNAEIKITETDAVGIVQRTSSGDWTAEDVTRAFCHRAAVAHQLVLPSVEGESTHV